MILAGAAWFYGYLRSGADILPLVGAVLPHAASIERRGDIFAGRASDGSIVGYAAVGSAPGYGGPIEMLVGVSPSGTVTAARVVTEGETPGFFRLFAARDFFGQYGGAPITRPLQLGRDLDGVSGATLSAEGIAEGVRRAVRLVAHEALGTPLPEEPRPVRFGVPEIVLSLLLLVGFAGHRVATAKARHALRWGSMLTGMIVIGFIYTAPLTIAHVVALACGYWPDWHNNLYWYLLVGGVFLGAAWQVRNPYCSWCCPFGAFQECLGRLTNAPTYRPAPLHDALKWVQRGLALVAVLLGVAMRRPGIATYEPYQALFSLQGTGFQWTLLVVISLASLLVRRPFCSYLCPIDPVVDLIGESRRYIKETWRSWRTHAANS
ncbi:MAG: FMN-binding protein [Acidobacteriota bacterium]